MTTPLQGVDISIKETGPDGRERRYVSRWMGHTKERGWFSASHLGQDHRTHSNEDAARRALAGWLRSQAMLICPDDQTIDLATPANPPAASPVGGAPADEDRGDRWPGGVEPPADPWAVPAAPSSAGLEDLL